LSTQPTNVAAMLWLAKALAGQSRAPEALTVYGAAMPLAGAPRQALVEAVDLAITTQAVDRARVLIATAHRSGDDMAAFAVASGDLAAATGQPTAAERRYREALKADPRSFDALSRLVERLVASRKASEAVRIAESSTRLVPDSPQHVALLGEARLAAGDAAGAENVLVRALQLAPDATLIRIALGRAQLVGGKSAAAITTLTPATPSGERDTLLGAAHAARADWPAAIDAFQSAANQGMRTPEVLNGLGWAYTNMGQTERALAAFEQSLSQKSNQPEIRSLVASLQRNR
jgi:Flp pilus assembly protein TadD